MLDLSMTIFCVQFFVEAIVTCDVSGEWSIKKNSE